MVPSSNTDIIGSSGNTYFRPCLRFEPELVVTQQRVALNEDVRHRVLVVLVAGLRELARHDAAAEPRVALENQHLLAGGRQIGRGHEAVVAGADGDDVVRSAHWKSSRL